MKNKKSTLMIHLLVAMLGLLGMSSSFAGYQAYTVNNNTLYITGDVNGQARNFSLRAPHINAFEVTNENAFHQQLPSFSLAHEVSYPLAVEETASFLVIKTGDVSARLNKQTMQLSFFNKEVLLIEEESGYFADENSLGYRFKLAENEALLGGGERVLGMNRRGHKFPLYNKAHYGYTTESAQMYFGLPALMSDKKYVLIFDNTARGEMDIGATEKDILSLSAVGGRSAYIIVAADAYPNLIKNYVELTGKQPLPPRWALGNFASRFGYHDQEEVLSTANKFREEDMPLDAIVLDLYWFGKDIKGHMGNLSWDKDAFPTPVAMIEDLQKQGVNTVVITEPFVLTTSNNWQNAVEHNALAMQTSENSLASPYKFDFYFGNTGLIDVFNQQGRDWFNQAYQSLYKQGVTGWWGDLGEPEVHPEDIEHKFDNGMTVSGDDIHNVYGHRWAQMVYEQQQEMAPNTRPMLMMRSGFVGSQRYGMIPWTGDVSRSWGGLKPQVELSLQMGLFGLAYTHSDLGGFAGGEVFDAEMYTRWLQYGVFQPVYRPHAQENIAPEPVFHDTVTKDIVRQYLKLRYQLLPYNYTLAYQNAMTGMPLMRPLFFENEALLEEKDTYLWGDAFLVTPVTEPGVNAVTVNVPSGIWFDYFTEQRITGGAKISHKVTKETIPVLVRAGSFIPMVAPIKTTQDYSSENLSIHYYHDASIKHAKGEMYEDDGKSANSIDSQAFEHLKFTAQYSETELTIALTRQGKGYQGSPKQRQIDLAIHQWQGVPKQVNIDDKFVPIVKTKRALKLASQAAFYNQTSGLLSVKFDWQNTQHSLTIK